MKKDALVNFTKCTGKHLCQRRFFNKIAGLRAAILFKKKVSGTGVFLRILRNFYEHLIYRTPLDDYF